MHAGGGLRALTLLTHLRLSSDFPTGLLFSGGLSGRLLVPSLSWRLRARPHTHTHSQPGALQTCTTDVTEPTDQTFLIWVKNDEKK